MPEGQKFARAEQILDVPRKSSSECPQIDFDLARSERFELPTLGFEVRCSIQLSYERLRARLPELAAQGYPQQNAVAVVRKSPTLVRGGLRSRDADGGPGQCSWPHPAHMHCSRDRRSRRRCRASTPAR